MANELNLTYTNTDDVYAIVRRTSNGQAWNGSALETWADANITTYDIPLVDQGGDLYAANFPSGLATNVEYRILYYEKASGADPAITDLLLASEEGIWDGTNLVKNLSTSAVSTSTTVFDDLTLLYATTTDVQKLLPRQMTRVFNQRHRHSQANLTTNDIEDYIRRAQSEIDGMLEDIYVVPLSRIKEVDRRVKAGTTSYVYPDPIPYCCQRLAAALVYNERFTGDASSIDGSVYGDRYMQQAMAQLEKIQRGTITLIGQKYKGWRYGRPESRNISITPQYNNRVDATPIK